jgi:hypothetical protein
MSTETLTEWPLRQVADDEEVANEAGHRDGDMGLWVVDDDYRHDIVGATDTRVLAECEAKRRIVALAIADFAEADAKHPEQIERSFNAGAAHAWHNALRLLALPYADRPGYLAEWAPR